MAQPTNPGSQSPLQPFNPVVGAGPGSNCPTPLTGYPSPGGAYNSLLNPTALPSNYSMSYNPAMTYNSPMNGGYNSPMNGGYNSPMNQNLSKVQTAASGYHTPTNYSSPSAGNSHRSSNSSINSSRGKTPSSRFDSPLSPFSSPSEGHSPRSAPRAPDRPIRDHPGCSLCYQNRETKGMYMSHRLKDRQGNVTCPVLFKLVCPYCRATGPKAHTQSYCPYNPGRPNFRFFLQGRNASGGYYKK